MLTHYYSTAERSVRLSKVVGSKGAHLGGQYTVHILAVSQVFHLPSPPALHRANRSLSTALLSSTLYLRHTVDSPPRNHQIRL